jgi:hypothetical protein
MNCNGFREQLALAAGGDLTSSEARHVDLHVGECPDCLDFYRRLQANQSVLRSLRQEAITPAALGELRQGVLTRIAGADGALGWRVRVERFVLEALRRPRYAVAGIGIVAILSLSMFGQMRLSNTEAAGSVIAFEENDTLLRPQGYREWVFAGSYVASAHHPLLSSQTRFFHNAYISPGAYREYTRTGEFPQGTVMVLETAIAETNTGSHGSYAKKIVALEASVKDSRFEGGWGYFDFTGREATASTGGTMVAKAKALPANAGCLSCHRENGEKDHVFTQFYPVLGAAWGVL